jgi:cbb3-type cytochrome oxidase cytochrome c subunit
MKTGISVFLVAMAAFGASWFGLVYGSVRQLGVQGEAVVLQSSDKWPQQRTGEATLGLQVYRANGCVACHTEQARQTGVASQLVLTSLGSHSATEFKDFLKSILIVPELKDASSDITKNVDSWNGQVPFTVYTGENPAVSATMGDKFKAAGVKAEARVAATGPDIARGWGLRQGVAEDYLYDVPAQPGSLRAGPDLSLIGVRAPDLNWQLEHLYAPRAVVPNSTMPAFRFLFEVRKAGAHPSPDALALPKEFAPADGMEVVPTAEARELAAYLVSLKVNAPLYEAPFTPVTAAK